MRDKRQSTARRAQPVLPPYGYMVGYQEDGARARARPVKWNGDDRAWESWFRRVLALISRNVWPVFADGTWAATPAAQNAVELTRADLATMRLFRARYNLALVGTTGLYHANLHEMEDEGSGWPPSIRLHCPELADPRFNVDKIFEHAIFDYAERFLPEDFKRHFQRPRPWQAALLLEPGVAFRHDTARSADTPSLVSGHALQALIVGCVAYESLRGDAHLAARNRKALQGWMSGTGDRRVMSGVHYPTDSLASWIVAAEIVDYLFEDGAVRAFLLEAIRESLLYRFLEALVPSTPAFRLPWACLQATLAKPSSRASGR